MTYAESSAHHHYVTARADGRTAILAGPFRTHAAALELEESCRAIVRERYAHDMSATFAEIGTTRVTLQPGRRMPLGKFNALLGV